MDNLSAEQFTRLANNFYNSQGVPSYYNQIALDSHLSNYLITHKEDVKKTFKVALVCICLNPPYWEYAREMMQGAKKFFLPGHQTDFFFWTDMKEADYGATVIPTEPVQWPLPTLMRYSLFLQKEEELSKYDYIFYCDIDMRFVDIVGDEILGTGLTAAQHPMYALDRKFIPPYESNKESTAYIKRPGIVINDQGQPRFIPMYYAGGFQGGKAKEFIEAMKTMKKTIDADFTKNFIAIWNDESHWNKYLYDNPPSVSLTPSYVYPDSLIEEYYKPIWGVSYQPKLITITKKHTMSKDQGAAVMKNLDQLKALK